MTPSFDLDSARRLRQATRALEDPPCPPGWNIAELSDVGSSNSSRLSPTGTMTRRTCSASTVSSGETVNPSFS